MDRIAVINAGSSSIKFALFEEDDGQRLLFRGQIENIGVEPRLSVEGADGDKLAEHRWGASELDHKSATKIILETAIGLLGGKRVGAVGHRVVHGGSEFTAPTMITADVIASLKKLCRLAPLHQPHNIAPIEAIQSAAPHIPQVACFDTAFHQTQSRLAYSYALPRELTESGVRRYGFHGLSYDYVIGRLRDVAPDYADKRIIVAHLGNGASLCAMHEGRSVATTMGFTAVEGLVMGTRCGAIDPGVLIYLMDEFKMDARALEKLQVQLCYLQDWVRETGARVVIVCEGRDTAGKGGLIKRLTERVSPRTFRVVALSAPNERDRGKLYLQRYMEHFPAAGEVVIFDRSWYNRAGVERVMDYTSKAEVKRFLQNVPKFERWLIESGVILIKLWLEVGMKEQDRRFRQRINDPLRQWKLSPMDVKSYSRWYDYSRARDAMFEATSHAPAYWYVIRSDDKKRARLNGIKHILSQIPYEKIKREKIRLGKRSNKQRYDDKIDVHRVKLVREVF
jgi:polyphosphate kinase 2